MCNGQRSPDHRGSNIYTLAQIGTGNKGKRAQMLTGCGSDITDKDVIKRRTKRKFISEINMLHLISLATDKGDLETLKGYWNTFHCLKKIYTANGKMYGRYCKNRFCLLCCSIRKAVIINKYLPVLKTWPEPYFVTLTIKAVPAHRLSVIMRKMNQGIKRITGKYRKRNIRNKDIKLMGIRSLECNFNPKTRTYNPHFHIIVPDKETGEILKMEWLKLWTRRWTYHEAQKVEKVFNNITALIEVVKYGSKIFTDPDLKKKEKSKGNEKIYVAALKNIFDAMKGIRIFERFGFNLPAGEKISSNGAFVVNDFQEWGFDISSFNWVNDNGEKLVDFRPEAKLLDFLENQVNLELE